MRDQSSRTGCEPQTGRGMLHDLRTALAIQRWDDHRFYHHSRINQSLHLLSAATFLATYVIVFFSPLWAALIGWLIAMLIRQIGHFFFEPKGYDSVNQVSHAHKERIKVGYNLRRKLVLLSVWALSPVVLWMRPSLWGLYSAHTARPLYLEHLGQLWLAIGCAALLVRTMYLCWHRDVQTGLVWLAKIITDPFHDIMLYHRAPLHLLRGELIDPMSSGAPARAASP